MREQEQKQSQAHCNLSRQAFLTAWLETLPKQPRETTHRGMALTLLPGAVASINIRLAESSFNVTTSPERLRAALKNGFTIHDYEEKNQ